MNGIVHKATTERGFSCESGDLIFKVPAVPKGEVPHLMSRLDQTYFLLRQVDVLRLTQDLGQTRLELAGAKSEAAEMAKLAEERQVTVDGMAGDLEKVRERDVAVWIPRLKEFGLRLDREPGADLVRPSWLDAEVWERDVLPRLTQKGVESK